MGKKIGLLVSQGEHGVTTAYYPNTLRLVLSSMLCAIAALLQAAGVFTGIGYIFSMLATGPVVLTTILSIRIGLFTYILTSLLLVIIQPTEIFVFLFTTGLLGVGLGVGFKLFKRSVLVTFVGTISLSFGIMNLLYLIQFPILGPSVTTTPSISTILAIFFFCLIYSWIWMRVSLLLIRMIERHFNVRHSSH